MATVTPQGVTSLSLADYVARLGDRFREAFGQDLSLDPETPQGQIIGIMALELAELDEAVVAQGNAMSLDHAAGNQMNDLGSLLDIQRSGATRSQVTATLTGVAGTAIPAGSRARTGANAVFETLADAVLTSSGIQAEMRALDTGPVAAGAGELNIIVTLIAGWEGITNAAAAVLGVSGEPDATYRARFRTRTAHSSTGPLTALEAAIAEAQGSAWRVEENHTSMLRTEQSFRINPHSILAVVEGGTDSALSRAIQLHKGMGVGITAAILGGAPDNTALDGVSDGTINWKGTDYTGLDLSSATTAAAKATAINTLLADAGVALEYVDGRYIAFYQWAPGAGPAFATGTVVDALGLDPNSADYPEGPFMRSRSRPLTVALAVTQQTDFPADGLARIRQGILDRVKAYGVGDQLWLNDLLIAAESVAGTRVTSITAVNDAAAAVSGQNVPLNNRWTLAGADLTITIT